MVPRLDKEKITEGRDYGVIPEEDFNKLYEKIPKHEEGKDDITFELAKEHLIRRAIDIKMVPTRLTRDLDNWHDDFKDPERELSDLFGNEKLSDVTITHPLTGA